MTRRRNDPRRESTRSALIEAAEELIAEKGVENVSLKQIGDAIGSENNAVVSYYFGTKASLIRAIYEYRIPDLEKKRSEILKVLDDNGLSHNRVGLFYALYMPIVEQKSKSKKANFAGFLASMANYKLISITELSQSYATTREISDRLRTIEKMPDDLFWDRMRLISMMMIGAIQDIFVENKKRKSNSRSKSILTNSLMLAASALSAPWGASNDLATISKLMEE